MEPLVEVHTDEEMTIALEAGARVVGVNNRNLHTFEMDLETTERVALVAAAMGVPWQNPTESWTRDRIVLSALSGITGPEDVKRFETMGVSMVLVGETLMRAEDPAKAIRTLLGEEDPTPVSEQRLVKVCGVTNVEDASTIATAGANLIGVIFAEGSPRRVTEKRARDIVKTVQAFGERNSPKHIEPPPQTDSSAEWFQAWSRKLVEASHRTPLVVGVFQNQPMEEIRRIVAETGLDLVQLHGDEGMEACAECGVPALRVVHVPAAAPGEERVESVLVGGERASPSAKSRAEEVLAQAPPNFAAGVLLDTSVKGVKGGTGLPFDHEVAKLVGEAGVPVIVAGGLDPDNVEVCVIFTESFGVDVSSGVEEAKGVKNPGEVKRFMEQARLAHKDLTAKLKQEEEEEEEEQGERI
ncbi:Bifunctional Indole-3-Glycerol Phosphate Synthase/Phosphoribosylanthranilate Isomerase (C-terminal) [Ectocarpus siliculosus]|uniref:Bifunctional Indole-3-Glycerol Phosphate Synthase/Phosphoribosylanthranilate Isomerase (C-terminal) n=1 Tax=Ectocarpus siliculosus TaxID=2880 RepID=D8LK76_ECTSI|nr:Bifunctional Indole-3-Glycerol Phosphate Synthase/Phosphoribosylanthranilate Isomerase (C-terminal) [Ectocarpus siliculosus]|eukprot:CBN76040.1 Bifunctional Indole-3-Glycerol Phosphate Synthase/Phosphoribosylanthranilate Isomerase (C-terminal) [Ectocarpus siliculosus]